MATALTLARPYAQAAFGVAKKTRQMALWSDALEGCAAALGDKQMQSLVKNPAVNSADLVTLLMQIAQSESQDLQNFLALLAQYHRLSLLPEIKTQFMVLQLEDEKVLEAELIVAFPISEQSQQTIRVKLEKRFDRAIKLTTHVDPALIGGALVRVGDQVIDGSLKSKIADLTTHLLT